MADNKKEEDMELFLHTVAKMAHEQGYDFAMAIGFSDGDNYKGSISMHENQVGRVAYLIDRLKTTYCRDTILYSEGGCNG